MDNGLAALYNQVQSDALHRGPNGADAYMAQTMQFLRGLAQARIAAQRGTQVGQAAGPSLPPLAAQTMPFDHQALIRYLTQTEGGRMAADVGNSSNMRHPAGNR